jgi:hypothetical protein
VSLLASMSSFIRASAVTVSTPAVVLLSTVYVLPVTPARMSVAPFSSSFSIVTPVVSVVFVSDAATLVGMRSFTNWKRPPQRPAERAFTRSTAWRTFWSLPVTRGAYVPEC